VDGNCCLAREETEYLAKRKDLISLAPCGDSAVLGLEAWVEDKFIRFCRSFRRVGNILGYWEKLLTGIESLS